MSILEGIMRRFTQASGRAATDLRLTTWESLGVAQVEPPNMEATRAGLRFLIGNSAAITGIAPVQALPTTAAQWAIWNASQRMSLILEELGVYLTSGTPGAGAMLLACLFATPSQDAVASTAGTSVASAGSPNGGSALGTYSDIIVKSAVTITVPAAPTWYPIAYNGSPNVTAFASNTVLENRNLKGRIIVPPKMGLGLAVVAPAGTTPLFAPFASGLQALIDNE
jgi:hypothetical protein